MAKHDLQRLSSPSRTFSLLLHLIGTGLFALQFHYLNSIVTPLQGTFGGSYQFLTILGLACSGITYVIAVVADLTLNPTLFKVKNVLSIAVTPLEVLISILYGTISAIDRNLLAPPEYRLPFLPDFGFHGMPAVLLTLDLLLLSPPWTIPAYSATALASVLGVLYWIWVEYCFSINKMYPYPLFGILSLQQRVLLFASTSPIFAVSTVLLKWLYGKVNGIEKFQRESVNPVKFD